LRCVKCVVATCKCCKRSSGLPVAGFVSRFMRGGATAAPEQSRQAQAEPRWRNGLTAHRQKLTAHQGIKNKNAGVARWCSQPRKAERLCHLLGYGSTLPLYVFVLICPGFSKGNTVIRQGTDSGLPVSTYWRPLTVSLDLSILQKMGFLNCIFVQQRCATHQALSSCNHP